MIGIRFCAFTAVARVAAMMAKPRATRGKAQAATTAAAAGAAVVIVAAAAAAAAAAVVIVAAAALLAAILVTCDCLHVLLQRWICCRCATKPNTVTATKTPDTAPMIAAAAVAAKVAPAAMLAAQAAMMAAMLAAQAKLASRLSSHLLRLLSLSVPLWCLRRLLCDQLQSHSLLLRFSHHRRRCLRLSLPSLLVLLLLLRLLRIPIQFLAPALVVVVVAGL